MPAPLNIKRATPELLPRLEEIREAAFAPVFESFRSIMGDEIYGRAQARDDAAQGELLASLLAPDSGWEVYAAEHEQRVVGFVSIRFDHETKVGELGLNAVLPDHAGHGIGTQMYEHAIARMREAGMRVAFVGTGGDPSHAPARRAYQKVGFGVELPTVWMYRTLD
ncbi:GNAT family N-acetyltransferase [Paraliomyxa miuraensis]|uniref:GNAT family N-acetyltransferase n=1 Tax=Paraliomyxa miuraensis TaxID=376150 RepID=UPI00225090D1|nr:GNAT family N-acetyltransferase [Paraliomyxa miuraensis]MCX4246317.1 GNAT family N-acetyltransferase [Paraliomyxa miuraensis]